MNHFIYTHYECIIDFGFVENLKYIDNCSVLVKVYTYCHRSVVGRPMEYLFSIFVTTTGQGRDKVRLRSGQPFNDFM